jgi:hypothetical protein
MCNFYFGGKGGAAQSFKFLFVDGLTKASHCKKKNKLWDTSQLIKIINMNHKEVPWLVETPR